jgi:hypothetical protein
MRKQYLLSISVLFSCFLPGWTQTTERGPSTPYSPFASPEEAEDFLHTASVIQSKPLGSGVSHATKLTLDDGKIRHNAVFKVIDVHRPGVTEINGVPQTDFKDSWKYEVAAYELDKLLGMNMVPVTVERKIEGVRGSVQLWMDGTMTEARRLELRREPPDRLAWNRQMYKYHLFDNLIYNCDSNLGNALITPDWVIFKIDHSRAFKNMAALSQTQHLVSFSRSLIQALEKLDKNSLVTCCKSYLSTSEMDNLLKRKDLILSLYRSLLAEHGQVILYP